MNGWECRCEDPVYTPVSRFSAPTGNKVAKMAGGDELTIRVGCYNVFEAWPPDVNGLAAGYEAELHDPLGRVFYGRLVSQF